jgi:hypothetical protein
MRKSRIAASGLAGWNPDGKEAHMRFKAILAGLSAVLVLAGTASSQDSRSTPESRRGVAPDLCKVEPRTIESLEAIVNQPASDGTDVRVPIRFAPGEGEPAGDVAARDVTEVMVELAACFNAGDILRVYALFSDEGLTPALIPEDIERAASSTPTPLADSDQFPEPIVWDARVQDDGRVTALVDFDGEIALVTFVWNEDQERYLIDFYDDQIAHDATPPAES